MPTQSCPNCERPHDVKVYVTGQKVLCACGIRFDVIRRDVVRNELVNRTVSQRPNRQDLPPEPPLAPADGAAPAGLETAPDPSSEPAGDATFVPRSKVSGGQPEARQDATTPSRPGLEVPGYELGELLGRGGMGEVWRAVQQSLGRTVAVKVLPPELARDPEFVARFEKESAALAALSHAHIIQIIDRGSAEGHYYFVMEYVEGRSLREAMGGGKVALEEAPRIILQILRAMEAAHGKQIIHRDLKPENILLDGRGQVKVADFGLAGIRGGEERFQMTATSVAMGTLNYMAPEQRRDARSVDARADLYAVGVILYELLTGELPIGRFKLPSERMASVDPRFDPIVARLLEPEPAHRYATASDVIAELEPWVGAGSGAGSGSRPQSAVSGSRPLFAPASGTRPQGSVVEKGFRGLRTGLMVIGALAVVGVGSRLLFGGDQTVTISSGGKAFTLSTNGNDPAQKKPLHSGNTYGELFTQLEEAEFDDGTSELVFGFGPGPEEFNVHTGEWRLGEGRLSAVQVGTFVEDGKRHIPRAYVAHRYFNADDFDVEADLTLRDVADRYEIPEDVQRFGEVAFRIRDLQVSAFAIPGVGMRLGWRYYTPDGTEVAGNSARDLEMLVEDETPTPPDGKPFKVRLRLRKHPTSDAVEATGYLNGRRFARKVLPGLNGQVGKIALGCRNYECQFTRLTVRGQEEERPGRRETNPVAAE